MNKILWFYVVGIIALATAGYCGWEAHNQAQTIVFKDSEASTFLVNDFGNKLEISVVPAER